MKTIYLFILILIGFSCQFQKGKETSRLPNVVLIMADDMGYECLSAYGSQSYKTPKLDSLAANGILFSHCVSQPLCTPSRVKIMTGKYNYRNYEYFGNLDASERTFGNLMKEAGYATCVAGKWQLNGINHNLPHYKDSTRPHDFGFDEYCLWQLTKPRREGERFANPLIEQNGKVLERDRDAYGPDIFANYILDFIDRKKDSSFFVYYPMVLVHEPFVPTPDSDIWGDTSLRYQSDTTYFKDMVSYTDKIVGKIADKLKEHKIDENTILIFTADNGTDRPIYSRINDRIIKGGKGNTIDSGTHVPLIVYYPKMSKKGFVFEDLIEFSDFYSTLEDIAGVEQATGDGKSFYPLLKGNEYEPRKHALVHYDPRWYRNNLHRNRFARTVDYKLYQDGQFFNLREDIMEENSLTEEKLSKEEVRVKEYLQLELDRHPKWNEEAQK